MKYHCLRCPWEGNHFKLGEGADGEVMVCCPSCSGAIIKKPKPPPEPLKLVRVSTYPDTRYPNCRWLRLDFSDGSVNKVGMMKSATATTLGRLLEQLVPPRPKGCVCGCHCEPHECCANES